MSASNGFAVPFSSSPPSTPDSRPRGGKKYTSNGFANHPSTTPIGPPPSSVGSFTPAGPPPSSIFGSSQLGADDSPFGLQQGKITSKRSTRSNHNDPSAQSRRALKDGGRSHPKERFSQSILSDDRSSNEREGEEDSVYEAGDPNAYTHDERRSGHDMEVDSEDGLEHEAGFDAGLRAMAPYDWATHGSSVRGSMSQRGTNRVHDNAAGASYGLSRKSGASRPRQRESAIPLIAKDIAKRLGAATLNEPDTLILGTEEQIKKLYSRGSSIQDPEQMMEAALQIVPQALTKAWQNCCSRDSNYRSNEHEYTIGIGPRDDEAALHKAAFVSTLLFKIRHPPVAKGKQAFTSYRSNQPSSENSFRTTVAQKEDSYPKVLLDWLEEYHNPYQNALAGLGSYQPNPTAHVNFWDILFSAALRGKLSEVTRILRDTDFSYARTAREDVQSQNGYSGALLATIVRVIDRAVQVLDSCPGIREDDWEISGDQWLLFRRRIVQAATDLSSLAEGRDRDQDPAATTFEAANFGLKSTSTDLSKSARRAESKVPWTIYQNLKALYGLLLGGTTELLSAAQDWVEATLALAIWWDGDDDEIAPGSVALSRRSYKRPSTRDSRLVDASPGAAYRRRIAAAFDTVTIDSGDEGFQIDSNNPVEVAVALIFEDNVDSVLNLLRSWSIPIASAVVEIGSQAGWYQSPPGNGLVSDFDESDLMVLDFGHDEKSLSKDGLLCQYADAIFERAPLKESDDSYKEGWELSIEILSRLDDTSLANKKIGGLLSQILVSSDERADKLIELCRMFSLDKEACDIAEKYADSVAESSDRYGTALIYYARSHNSKKVKDVLDLLISYCLVKSIAYPPVADLDAHLSSMLAKPRDSILWIAGTDPEAAEILSMRMSGYATLRKFYDTRDEEISGHSSRGLVARMKAAAVPLLTVIASAADNIQGGLYDENSAAVVPVDGLLVLLGEATVFVDRKLCTPGTSADQKLLTAVLEETRYLSLPQLLIMLRAIEDLQTVHARIRSQCEECFTSTLASALGTARVVEPRDLLKKSVSSITTTSGFSLVGSSMLQSGSSKAEGLSRGWDWRPRLKPGHGGKDMLNMLRLGLAREVARAWMAGEEL